MKAPSYSLLLHMLCLCLSSMLILGCGGDGDGEKEPLDQATESASESEEASTNDTEMAANDMEMADDEGDMDSDTESRDPNSGDGLFPFEQSSDEDQQASTDADADSPSDDQAQTDEFDSTPDQVPSGPLDTSCNLGGNWSGRFYNTVLGLSEGITATVTTSDRSIVIRTSKSSPPGQLLTGEINGQCGITLIDASDGSDWTTKFGAADGNQIRIADFLVELRDPETGEDPLDVIELYR